LDELFANLSGAFVSDVLVYRGVRFDVSAVYGDGSEFEELERCGEFEHTDEGILKGHEVLAAEFADGIVIGMGVASEKTHGDIAMGGTLDLTRGEKSVGIAVDEEREHHVWRELPRACATVVDLKAFERQTMDGLNGEVDEIVFGDPVTHVRGQQHWCFTVDVDEAGTHAQTLSVTLDL
ncbi:MAG: hypothetical protein ACI9DF_006009, partial [Verrucomicrobiales bacterium]